MGENGPDHELQRYERQIVLPELGLEGQRQLMAGRALIIGVGGLGSWVAELLARAGVGLLRLVDDDVVELANVHRQALYGEQEATERRQKAPAAAARLAQINQGVKVEAVVERVDRFNLDRLACDVDVIIDGTDNFETRFLINDYAVKHCRIWLFAGVIGTEAMTCSFVPGRTMCLRCLIETVPGDCGETSCRQRGVLGPAVAAVAAFQASEAIKVLSGNGRRLSPDLLKFDLWGNQWQRVSISRQSRGEARCVCCDEQDFEFLER